MSKLIKIVLFVLMLFSGKSIAQDVSICGAILKSGIYDKKSALSTTNQSEVLNNFLCKSQSSSSSSGIGGGFKKFFLTLTEVEKKLMIFAEIIVAVKYPILKVGSL